MTPAELNLYVRAYNEQQKERQKVAQVNLYNLSALIRSMVWAKHPPTYERSFGDGDNPQNDDMTDEQMYAMARALNALYGGEEVS